MTQSESHGQPPVGSPQGSQGSGPSGLKSYSPLQVFFLYRLTQLLKKRRETASVLPKGDWRLRLLNKALYSTYRDCVELGVGDEARRLLGQTQQSN